MIWPLIQVLLVLGLSLTILSYSSFIDRLGRVLFGFVSAITWYGFGISLFKIRFYAGGSSAMVFWDFTLGSNASGVGIVWIFYALAFFQLVITLIRAWAMVYQPVIDNVAVLSGEDARQGVHTRIMDDTY